MPEGNVYELKIEWDENKIPTISEVIMLNDDEYASTAANDLQKYINSLDVKENKYKEFEKALKQAQKVLDKQAGELDAITNAKAELEVSYANLVKRGDIQSVKDELDTINKLKEKDYTSDSWETFARVLESAKAVQKNESATQEEVYNATALLTEAMDNLEPVKEEPVKEADKKELKKAIANAEKYTRVDYTEESWNDFQTALQAAYLVDNNTAATQKEVDDALQALQTAIKNLKKVQEEVKKDDIRKYIEKAQKLKEAVEAANKDDVTQAEIDQKTEALKQAIGNLKKADGKDTGKDNNKNNDNKGNGQNVSNNNANGKNPKGGNHKNVGKNNKNNNGNAAKTGDTMPVIPIASAVAAFAVIAEIIRRRIKNR